MISYSEAKDLQDFTLFIGEDTEIEGYFTNARIDRNTLPQGKYAYDLREGDDGDICAIEEKVVVNHAGTFICDQPVNFGEKGYLSLGDNEEADYSF